MSTERPTEARDGADRAKKSEPTENTSSIVDEKSQKSYSEMNDARARGAASGLAEIDRGNAPEIIDSSRRQGSDKNSPKDTRVRDEHGEPIRTVPHVVTKGQALWTISAAHQSDNGNQPNPKDVAKGVEEILRVNPKLDPNAPIREGQNLQIPERIRTGFRPEGRHVEGAPTAMVLDTFDGPGSDHQVADTSHGGFLAKAFNALGFNVIRANMPESAGLKHTKRDDFTTPIERAANYIEANREQFPPGSFLNTSFGNNVHRDSKGRPVKDTGDLTWKELSTMVKMDVNAGNMKESTGEVLRRLEHVAEGRDPVTGQPDNKISAHDKEIASAAVRTNAQIERIQKMGVEVIHSAGNDGSKVVDINFLRATNLRADAPKGPEALKFSGVGNHTEHGAGVIPVYRVDKDTVAADVNGYTVRMPINKDKQHDMRDHRINYDAIQSGDRRHTFPVQDRKNPEQYDVDAHKRGYDQRVYKIGNRVDSFTGTSFSPISYLVKTRNIQRPPEP